MQGKVIGKVTISFPPMSISRIGIGLMRTADEPFTGKVEFDDGRAFNFAAGDLPPTDVHAMSWPLLWKVDACVGKATNGSGTLLISIPAEDVQAYPLLGYSVAKKVPNTRIDLSFAEPFGNTTHFSGVGELPACKVPFFGKAEAVVFTCSISPGAAPKFKTLLVITNGDFDTPPIDFIPRIGGGKVYVYSYNAIELLKAFEDSVGDPPPLPNIDGIGRIDLSPAGFDDNGNITGMQATYNPAGHDLNQDKLQEWDRAFQRWKQQHDDNLLIVNAMLTKGKNPPTGP